MKLTPAQKRALDILKANPGIQPSEFAEKIWPDSEGWTRSCKCGPAGSRTGAGMALAAGGFLGRLQKAGLAEKRAVLVGRGRSVIRIYGWYANAKLGL